MLLTKKAAVAAIFTVVASMCAPAVAVPAVAADRFVIGVARFRSLYGSQGQCIDADANNGSNGTKVQVWTCNGTDQQKWIYWNDYTLESVRFRGMCMDADLNGGGTNGTRIQLWQCNGQPQQYWYTFSNDLAIYNSRFLNNYNTVVDRDITVSGNGARIQLWAKNYQPQQWWRLEWT